MDQFGPSGFAVFTLLSALLIMLPFADLGLGVAMLNATADAAHGRKTYSQLADVYVGVRCILLRVGAFLTIASGLIALTVGWPTLLGLPDDSREANFSCFVVMVVIGVSLPLGVGARLLQGYEKMDAVTKIAILNPVVQLLLVVPLAIVLNSAAVVAIVPALAFLLVAVVTDCYGRKQSLSEFGIRLPAFVMSMPPGFRISRILGQSSSFLIISIGLVLAFQAQRLILAHRADGIELARYSLVVQYLLPVLSIIGVIAQSLWPRYRSQMGRMQPSSLYKHICGFAIMGAAGAGVMVLTLILVSRILLDSAVELPVGLLVASAAYVFLSAAHQPSAVVLNDQNGLRVQAVIVIAMASVSMVATVALSGTMGATGAILALVVAVGVFQLGPTAFMAARHIRISSKLANIFAEKVT
ncbi:hypothetical protein R3P93_17925 [Rhodococcus cerastii]|uniref:Polysaccharide biosynthesis protein n=1 Tax=Rhodococcus cerastii TaxID=908616 RepID=A0ABU4D575_9NOCA|nr:hypothetical protein [Rhodococcus cerastii]MDV6304442.1 hypothetical protein [Rhodococcus cerastii]